RAARNRRPTPGDPASRRPAPGAMGARAGTCRPDARGPRATDPGRLPRYRVGPADTAPRRSQPHPRGRQAMSCMQNELFNVSKPHTRDEINAVVWRACDTFRGAVDPSEYKNYILTMLFLRYLSDLWKDRQAAYRERYKGDEERVSRAMARERFVVPPESDFDFLYSKRDAANLGELINIALENIEDANKANL